MIDSYLITENNLELIAVAAMDTNIIIFNKDLVVLHLFSLFVILFLAFSLAIIVDV